jgi:hypothetical protein
MAQFAPETLLEEIARFVEGFVSQKRDGLLG